MTAHEWKELRGRLEDAVDSRLDAMRAFVEELVRIPSENPPGRRYGECARAIEARLQELRFPVERIAAPEGRFILRSFLGETGPTLYFHGHYDVVPAQSPGQFEPHFRKDNLFARG
jgi:acetylornithine deacetylase/succinyl-diaminopimelate desuccinylase-like protein